jgi:uncharacterized membrane protein YhaH (DUF805 family)
LFEITDNVQIARAMVDSIHANPVFAMLNVGSSFLAVILMIITLIFAIKDSGWTANKYGPSPKYS